MNITDTPIRFSIDSQPMTHGEIELRRKQSKIEFEKYQLIESLSLSFAATFLMFFLFTLLVFGESELCVQMFYSDYEFSFFKVLALTTLVLGGFFVGMRFRGKKERAQKYRNRLQPVTDQRRVGILARMEKQFPDIRSYCDKIREGERGRLVEAEWSIISLHYSNNFSQKAKGKPDLHSGLSEMR